MKTLDSIDLQILSLLQEDAKSTIKDIAAKLGMTTTPVYERIKRMEESGYLTRYVALLNRNMLDFKLVAFCQLQLKDNHNSLFASFEEKLSKLDKVVECYHTAGISDFLIKVLAKDMEDYSDFLMEELYSLDNIHSVTTLFVTRELKHTTQLPLPAVS